MAARAGRYQSFTIASDGSRPATADRIVPTARTPAARPHDDVHRPDAEARPRVRELLELEIELGARLFVDVDSGLRAGAADGDLGLGTGGLGDWGTGD